MVKGKVVIDTSVIIDHLRKAREGKSLLETTVEKTDIEPLISVAVIQELLAGQSSKDKEPEEKIRKVLHLLNIIAVTSEIAKLAGQIMRDTKPPVQFADAQIAEATMGDFLKGVCLVSEVPLYNQGGECLWPPN